MDIYDRVSSLEERVSILIERVGKYADRINSLDERISSLGERMGKSTEEIVAVRKVCWPICQHLREKSQLSNITAKAEFLNNLSTDEAVMLLQLKERVASPNALFKGRLNEEWTAIIKEKNQ